MQHSPNAMASAIRLSQIIGKWRLFPSPTRMAISPEGVLTKATRAARITDQAKLPVGSCLGETSK